MLDEQVFKDNIFLIPIKIYDSYSALTIKTNRQTHYLFFFFVFVFVYCLVFYSDMVGNLNHVLTLINWLIDKSSQEINVPFESRVSTKFHKHHRNERT